MVSAAASVNVYAENLDFRYFRGPAYETVLKTYLRDKYQGIAITVLVTVGPAAFAFGMQVRSELWADVPLVAAAADPKALADAASGEQNVTGRSLQLSLEKSIEIARTLVPDLKQVALVGDPFKQQPFRHHFVEELPQAAKGLSVLDLTGRPLEEVKKSVAALPEHAAVIYTAMTNDGAGMRLLSYEACRIVASATTRPIVVDIENRIGHGGTGGPIVQNATIGEEVAAIVLRILNGESASQIPPAATDAVRPTFDWRQLRRLGISESLLPAGSAILFREPTSWQQYRWRILLAGGALGLQTLLIFGLFYEDRRRRTAEENAHQLSAELAHMNRIATAGELTASIAHEIRQPLTSMVVAAETGLNWLKHKVPQIDEVRSSLQNIVNEGHRADDVIRNLNAMFRKGPPERAPIDINILVEEVLALVARKIQANDIQLRTDYADNPVVRGNPVQLQQVFMNLIVNAIEAMSGYKVPDHVLQLRTELGPNDHVSVIVQDSGPGIEPANIGNVFKPFFSTKSEGMGLGLAICKTIVDAHGGQLTVTPNGVSGTVFKVMLPIDKGERQ